MGSVVLGVGDLRRAQAFWERALDYVPREPGDPTWVVLVPRDGSGHQLSLMLSETPAQERPRVHLDLYADDQAAEVRRLKELGATDVAWDLYPADADFVVLADPEGNRFCVVEHS